MEFWEILIILVLIVLLPIIPAYILYKAFPKSNKVIAKGPFKGLNINIRGAFAGYFIVLLLLSGLLVYLCYQIGIERYEEWTVEGTIRLEKKGFDTNEVTISIKPPGQNLTNDGRFFIENIYLPKKKTRERPELIVHKAGYKIETLILEEKVPSTGFKNYNIKIHKDNHIEINEAIVLRQKKNPEKYSENGANKAEQMGGE